MRPRTGMRSGSTWSSSGKGHGVDVYMVLFTDVIGNASDLFVAGDHTLLAGLDYEDQPVHLKGVMSRKKDFVPVFGQKLKNI